MRMHAGSSGPWQHQANTTRRAKSWSSPACASAWKRRSPGITSKTRQAHAAWKKVEAAAEASEESGV